MNSLYIALLLSLWLPLILAQYPPNEFCFRSCQQALRSSVHFNATNPSTGQTCTPSTCDCINEIAIKSLYLCNKLYCNEDERVGGLNGLNETCRAAGDFTLPPFSVIDGYGDDELRRLKRFESEDAKEWDEVFPVINEVVIVGNSLYKLAYDTLDAAYFELRTHWIYGFSMYIFWLVVIIIGLTSHFARFLAEQEQKWEQIPEDDTAAQEASIKRKEHLFRAPYTLLKKHITVPATFGYTRSQSLGWWATIPTRVQSITIGVFVLLNIFLCSISYRVVHGNLYWKAEHTQMWRYVADRTGIISTANLILIWTFGIRNNTLMWLTGWDFATYNNFHRWVARVATVEAIVHSVAYTVLISENGTSWPESWDYYVTYYLLQKYFWNGILATVFMSFICLFSIYGLRRNFYETFLALHIILSIGVLVTMWYHVEIFLGAYNWFLYPCFFIWVLDRVFRMIRILLFNPNPFGIKAKVSYSPSSNIIRLTVPYTKSFIAPRPGTYYYISSLSSLKFWESHPFTLGYSTPRRDALLTESELSLHPSHGTISPPVRFPSPPLPPLSPSVSSNFNTPITPTSTTSSHFESETLLKSPWSLPPPETLTFLIRPYSGFTSRLQSSALHHPATHRVAIDGPYGETQPLQKYNTVLFVVGGTGIVVLLSYLSFLLTSEDSKVESLKIIWAVREEAFLKEAIATDFRNMLGDERLELVTYITGHDDNQEREPCTGGGEEDGLGDNIWEAGNLKGVEIRKGRPNVEQEIEEAARDVGRNGELAVVACGPGQMVDDARRKVVNILGRGWGKVEYFEESFNW